MKIKKLSSLILAMFLIITMLTTAFLPLNAVATTSSDQMLHLTNFTGKVGLKVVGLEKDGTYTFKFRYHNTTTDGTKGISDVAFEADSASVAVYYKQEEGTGQAAMQYAIRASSGFAGIINSYVIDKENKTVEVSFKLNNVSTAIDDIYYIGFYSSGSHDFYIADMLLYKNSDTTQTNLLPANPQRSDWYKVENNYFSQNLPSYYAYEDLNEEYFPEQEEVEPVKQMLYVNGVTEGLKYGLKVDGSVTAGANYTVEFKYYQPNENAGYIGDRFRVYYKQTASAQGQMQYSNHGGAGKEFTSMDIGTSTAKITFNITSDTAIDNCYYVGFYTYTGDEFYVADMVMYKTDDANKTNLLPDEPTAANWDTLNYQTLKNGLPGSSKYVDYNEEYFPEEVPVKQMLHVNGVKGSLKYGLKVAGEVTPGANYTVEFKYYQPSASEQAVYVGDRFRVYYKQGDAQGQMQYSNHGGTGKEFTSMDIGTSTAKITFNITSDTAVDNNYYVGFFTSNGDGDEFYIVDMVMYKTDDAEKTNLLPSEPTSSDWYALDYQTLTNGLPGSAEYVDYNEEFFPEEPLVGDGNYDDVIDICDLVYAYKLMNDGTYQRNIDINKDNKIDNADLSEIRRYLLGFIQVIGLK